MYDTLLDHTLEDDSDVSSDDVSQLAGHLVSGKDSDDDDEVNVDASGNLDDVDDGEEEGLLDGDDNESWSDDPVRMYLTQMGEIPLLTRQEEISPGQADRDHPRRVPPQGAGMRLRDAAAPSRCCAACTTASCRSTARCRFR